MAAEPASAQDENAEQAARLGIAPEPPVDEIVVKGTSQLSFFKAGGKAPSSATIRLVGGAIAIEEGKAYKKGDVVRFSGTAVVREVGQVDTADPKTQIVVSASQKHVARILDVTCSGVDDEPDAA